MSQPVSVLCPMCGAGMKLKDRSKLGKKASCPNCSNLFVLTEADEDAAPPSRSRSSQEPAALPPRRSSGTKSSKSAGRKSKGKRSKAGGGSNSGLLIGGGVVAVLLLVGVGLWASGIFSGDDNPPPDQPVAGAGGGAGGGGDQPVAVQNKVDLAYLPADAELFVKLNLADAWQSPMLMQLASLPKVQQGLQELQQTLGLSPADVESLTVGATGVSEQAGQPGATNPAAMTSVAQKNTIVVLRLNKEVDAASLKLVENGCKELQHDSKTYYLFEPPVDETTNTPEEPVALFLAEPKLAVVGSEAQVKTAISGGGKQTRRADLDFVDPNQQLVVVVIPKDKELLKNAVPSDGGPGDPAGEMAMVAAQNVQAIGIGLNVGTGLDLKVQANCTDTKAAGELKQILDGLVSEARSAVKNPESGIPPTITEPAETVLSTLQSSVDNSTVTASINVSDKSIASLQQAVPLLMLGMLAGNGPAEPLPKPIDVPTEAPEGIEVSAIARWDDANLTGPENEPVPPDMHLLVYLIGKQAQSAAAWGMVKLQSATTDSGSELKLESEEFNPNDPTKAFVPVERGMFQIDHPQQGVCAVLRIKNPGQSVKKVARAAGTVSLQVAKEQKTVILKNASSLIGKMVDDPVVKEAEIQLDVAKEDSSFNLKLVKGNPLALVQVEPVDAAGKPLDMVSSFRSGFGNQVTYGVFLGDDAPADFGLKLTLNTGLSRVDVPFEVSDIRIPFPPGAPGQPPASTEGIPDGVTIAGKTAWSQVIESVQNGKELPPPLDVLVTLTGEQAKKGVAWGFVKVEKAEGAGGIPLALKVREFAYNGEPTKEFIRVTRGSFEDSHPADGVQAKITLGHPAKAITEIASINGSLKLRYAKEQKVVKAAGFISSSGKLISDPVLKQAGLALKLEGKDTDFKLKLVKGDDSVLAKIDVVDAAGKRLEDLDIARNAFQDDVHYRIASFGEKIPADAVLQITVNLGVEELTVPFHFTDLMIPDLPLK